MSLQCPSSPTYHTSAAQKRNAKNAAKMYRFGTPKLSDMLREKCRIRLHKARQASFAANRSLNKEIDFDIKEILRSELAELEQDINLQEQIYNELVEEFNEWYAAQLEHEESYMIDMAEHAEDGLELLCPVCMQKPLAQQAPQEYSCACGANFQFAGHMAEFSQALQDKINTHEQKCQQPLHFYVEPSLAGSGDGKQHLSGMCDSCDYFCSL